MSDIPYSQDAEECVLGAMLLSPQAIGAVHETLTSGDFYLPSHAAIYDAILGLYDHGTKADPVTVMERLRETGFAKGIEGADLLALQINTPSASSGSAAHYANTIIDRAIRRRIIGEALEVQEQARDLTLSPGELLESHKAALSNLGAGLINREPDDVAVEDFVSRPKDHASPWVIYGVIRRRHKLMIVAQEGGSKSWLLRFIAICAAYGVHPFRHQLEKPLRTLIVDGENPEDALMESFEHILGHVTKVSPESETVNRLWWRPQGINLRSRADLADFENVLRARQPQLVCLGPLYAMYENSNSDFGWEQAAREVQGILKRLMVRYDFALMIEDHAPQSSGGNKREMRPYGSSFWRRWPDVGIGMEAEDETNEVMKLTRWRGDRVVTDWPKRIARGSMLKSPWPFVGDWGHGWVGVDREMEEF